MNPPSTSTPDGSSRRISVRTPKSTPKKMENEKRKQATSANRRLPTDIKERRQSASDGNEVSVNDAACLPMTDMAALHTLRGLVEQRRKQARKSKSFDYLHKFNVIEHTINVNRNHVTDTVANDGVKKKAGRPRKSITTTHVYDDMSQESEQNCKLEIGNMEDNIVKKKHGRPRKSVNCIPVEDHLSDRGQNQIADIDNLGGDSVRKKSGRPRKSITGRPVEEKLSNRNLNQTLEEGGVKTSGKIDMPIESDILSHSEPNHSLDTIDNMEEDSFKTYQISGDETLKTEQNYIINSIDVDKEHATVKKNPRRPRKSATSISSGSSDIKPVEFEQENVHNTETYYGEMKILGKLKEATADMYSHSLNSAESNQNETLDMIDPDSCKKKHDGHRNSGSSIISSTLDKTSADSELSIKAKVEDKIEKPNIVGRKPGRPRKLVATPASDDKSADTETNQTVNNMDTSETNNSNKKKRGSESNTNLPRSGRKRKQIDYSALDESGFEESKEADEVKQKKRKHTDNDEEVEVENNIGDYDDDTEEEITPLKGKRPRGRPRKNIMGEADKSPPAKKNIMGEADKSPPARKNIMGEADKSPPARKSKVKAIFNCQRCDFKANTPPAITTHMACIHQALWSPEHPEGLVNDKSLTTIIKIKKYLNCTQCDKRINFIQYYRKHIEWCGREDETYTCSVCGHFGLLLKWKDTHDLYCAKRLAQQQAQLMQAEHKAAETEKIPVGGKRRAATKAKSMLHNLSKDLDAGEHSDDSVGDPTVNLDKASSDSDDDIDAHDDMDDELGGDNSGESVDGDDGDMIDCSQPSRSTKFPPVPSQRRSISYMNSYPHMISLVDKKFAKEELFLDLLPRKQHWNVVPESELAQYSTHPGPSIGFKFQSEKKTMSNLDLYETRLIEGFPMIYTGLSVWHLAWCPVPVNRSTDQYLAVSGKLDHDATLKIYNRHTCPGVVQIWNMGVTSNNMKVDKEPRLCYTIAHDYGHVTGMQWCPSGCWQPANSQTDSHYSRLGLLALTFTDGSARIFSIPRLEEDPATQAPVYQTEPAMSLLPHRAWDSCNLSCSCLGWKPIEGHGVIVAGYSDGCVRLFNLLTESPLLVIPKSPHRTLVPYHSFQAHTAVVRTCGWTSTCNNKVITAGDDLEIRWWDLESTRFPRNMDTARNYVAVRFACPLVHHGTCISTDDSHCYHGNRGVYQESEMLKYITQGENKWNRKQLYAITLFLQNGCAWGADFNNWLNVVFMSDSRGHILGVPMMDTYLGSSESYRVSNRLKLFETKLVEKRECDQLLDKSHSEPEQVEECQCNTDQSETCKHCANQSHRAKQMTCETVSKSQPVLQNSRASEGTSSQSEDVLQNSCERTKVTSDEDSKAGISPTSNAQPHESSSTKKSKAAASAPSCDIGSYSEMVDKMCLVFNEYIKTKNAGAHNHEPRDMYNRFPITSWNAVATNPNQQTCFWLAFGGESGLVRLVNINKLRPALLVAYMNVMNHK